MAIWSMHPPAAGTAPCHMAMGHPRAWPIFRAPTICTGISQSRQTAAATDHMKECYVTSKIFAPALFAALAFAVPALAADYQTNLGPMPLDDETKAVIAGRGDATATSDGKTLSAKGAFHGLPSNAT